MRLPLFVLLLLLGCASGECVHCRHHHACTASNGKPRGKPTTAGARLLCARLYDSRPCALPPRAPGTPPPPPPAVAAPPPPPPATAPRFYTTADNFPSHVDMGRDDRPGAATDVGDFNHAGSVRVVRIDRVRVRNSYERAYKRAARPCNVFNSR